MHDLGDGTSRVTVDIRMVQRGLFKVLDPVFHRRMGNTIRVLLSELKLLMEQGELSPAQKKKLATVS